MSQQRYKEIFEEKARMNGGCDGGLRIGGRRGKNGKYVSCTRTGTNSAACEAAATNPWIIHVKGVAKEKYRGDYAMALADPATRDSYRPLSKTAKDNRARERQSLYEQGLYPGMQHHTLRNNNYPDHNVYAVRPVTMKRFLASR